MHDQRFIMFFLFMESDQFGDGCQARVGNQWQVYSHTTHHAESGGLKGKYYQRDIYVSECRPVVKASLINNIQSYRSEKSQIIWKIMPK